MLIKKSQLELKNITNCHGGEGELVALEKIFNKSTSGIRFFHETTIPPGSTIGIHNHEDNREEIFIIREGSGLFIENGKEQVVEPGDVCFYNKESVNHGIKPLGNQPLVIYVIGVNK